MQRASDLPNSSLAEPSSGWVTSRRIQLLLCLFATLFICYWAIRTGRQASRTLDSDFGVYYRAGQDLWTDSPLYNLDHGLLLTYKYAPIVAVLWMPLAQLDPVAARVIWCLMDLAALAAIFAVAIVLVKGGERRSGIFAVVFLLTLGHIIAQLHSGQTTSIWILLTMLSFVAMTKDRPVISGSLLALAVCFKCVPIALLPIYLFSRRPVLCVMSFAVSFVILCLLPAVMIGWEQNVIYLAEWPYHLFDTNTVHQLTRPGNQSVLAQIARWFTSPQGTLLLSLNELKLMWLILAGVTGLVMLRVISRTAGVENRAFHLSILFIFITLFNPLAWRYNFIALIVPYAYVVDHLLRTKPDARWLLIVVAGILNTLILPTEVFEQGGRIWGTLALLVAVIWTYEVNGVAIGATPVSIKSWLTWSRRFYAA